MNYIPTLNFAQIEYRWRVRNEEKKWIRYCVYDNVVLSIRINDERERRNDVLVNSVKSYLRMSMRSDVGLAAGRKWAS